MAWRGSVFHFDDAEVKAFEGGAAVVEVDTLVLVVGNCQVRVAKVDVFHAGGRAVADLLKVVEDSTCDLFFRS